MISRTLIRTRVMQTLYAYYKDGEKTPTTARKELYKSYSSTYSLYYMLLELVNELTRCAQEQIDDSQAKARCTHQEYIPTLHFVNNRFAKQLFENRALRNYIANQHLNWDSATSQIHLLFKQVQESPIYQKYMSLSSCTYEDDLNLWKQLFTSFFITCETLNDALEELEVQLDMQYWTTDLDIICSFIVKTIKRFHEDSSPEQELLPMFNKDGEDEFGSQLLQKAIESHDEYTQLINTHLKNWDKERLADMDTVIIQVALAEIFQFPEIALEISLNEYIELAKEYSSEKSHIFVNGVLSEILHDLKLSGQLMKAATIK